jgi:hypothetical protein
MTPDWANKPSTVPYAQLENPQSLNLYAYVGNNPLSKNDPDGHLESQWHFLITLAAGLETGHGLFGSLKLARKATAVDYRKGSQGIDAAHTNWHAMEGKKPDGNTQTATEARAGTSQVVSGAMKSGDTWLADHAVQGLATPLHDGHAWTGVDISYIRHFIGDNFPSIGTIKKPSRIQCK